MADDINDLDVNDLDGLNDLPLDENASAAVDATGATDPNDEVPVPIAMWPSEIDERAQVVEALRGNGPPPRTDTQIDPNTEPPADRA
jgi:hypothetical protein